MTEPGRTWRARTTSVPTPQDETFVDYVRRREPSLLRIAYLITGDAHHAEDLVQTTLAKLYAHWDEITDPASLDGYVRRILVNTNNSAWRRPGVAARSRRSTCRTSPTHAPAWTLTSPTRCGN